MMPREQIDRASTLRKTNRCWLGRASEVAGTKLARDHEFMRRRAAAARLAHNQEVASATPAAATNSIPAAFLSSPEVEGRSGPIALPHGGRPKFSRSTRALTDRRGSMAAEGKSHLASTELHKCTFAACQLFLFQFFACSHEPGRST